MRALILVDIQNDFMPGGPLAARAGDEVIPVANQLIPSFDVVVATQDWHPPDHGSFASNHEGCEPGELIELDGLEQILWPDHCVQGSSGAELVEALDREPVAAVIRKGMDPKIDSYSGFYDNDHRETTGLAGYLREKGVEQVWVMGVATDYCVKFTALDARREGFETYLIEDGCRGVEQQAGDIEAALEAMKEAGVQIAHSEDALGLEG